MSTSTRGAGPVPRDDVLGFAELVTALAQQQKLPDSKVRSILRGLFALTAEGLKSGKSVRIQGLGMLRVREPAAAAPGRVPGKRIVLAAEKALKAAAGL
jgi:nucleoid DNA-binding protein